MQSIVTPRKKALKETFEKYIEILDLVNELNFYGAWYKIHTYCPLCEYMDSLEFEEEYDNLHNCNQCPVTQHRLKSCLEEGSLWFVLRDTFTDLKNANIDDHGVEYENKLQDLKDILVTITVNLGGWLKEKNSENHGKN